MNANAEKVRPERTERARTAAKPPRRPGKETQGRVLLRLKRLRLLALLAALLAACCCTLGLLATLSSDSGEDPAESGSAPAATGGADLAPAEILAIAESALREGNRERAASLLDEIESRIPPENRELVWKARKLARRAGMEPTSRPARGAVPERLVEADLAFDTGDYATARDRYVGFLLSGGDPSEELLAWSHARLALSMSALWQAEAGPISIPEPKLRFQGENR